MDSSISCNAFGHKVAILFEWFEGCKSTSKLEKCITNLLLLSCLAHLSAESARKIGQLVFLITIRRERPTRIMVCESIWKIAVQRSCPLSTDISVPQSDASCAGIVCVGIVGSIQALSQLNIKLTTTLFSGFLDFCWLWLIFLVCLGIFLCPILWFPSANYWDRAMCWLPMSDRV